MMEVDDRYSQSQAPRELLKPNRRCSQRPKNRSKGSQDTLPLPSNSPYSFILGLMSVFSCFGTGNRRFQTVCMACRRALERVPGIDMQVS